MSPLCPPANVLPLRPRDDDENTQDLAERKREEREHHPRRPAVSYQFLWKALGIAR